MRVDRMAARISVVAALCAGIALAAPRRARQAAPAQKAAQSQAATAPKPGEPPFKNLQVLQDFPREKVLDGMEYIAFALGTRCEFCHNAQDFSNDDKKEKKTARQMMKMLFAINKDNFNGRASVSCYTCHQGRYQPMIAPLPLDSEGFEPPPGPAMPRAKPIQLPTGTAIPTVDAILAKYKQAVGGDEVAPSSLSFEVVRNPGGDQHIVSSEQVYEKAPNKILIAGRGQQGPYSAGFDGTKAWESTERGTRELSGMDALLLRRAGQLNPAAALDAYTNERLAAMVQLGEHKAWVVVGKAPDGNFDQFCFDVDSGLLLRRAIVYQTIFGELLYAIYYRDYRKENGFEIPFQSDWWEGGHGWTETVKSVQVNAAVTDAQFEPPAKPAQPAASSPGSRH